MTDMACWPNWSELSVSKASEEEGATHTQSAVLARPPKAPERRRVSLVSRKGGLPALGPAARAWTHRPRQVSELLMKHASSKACPVTCSTGRRKGEEVSQG